MYKKLVFMTVLFFLFFSAVTIAGDICIACEGIAGASESNILLTLDEIAEEVDAFLYYENYTAYSEGLIETPRVGIENTVIFIYVTDSLGNKELLRLYTDDEGYATFDFSDYAALEGRLTYGFKFIYCPFCHPDHPGYPCGFEECMTFAGIETNYTSPEDIPTAEGVSVPSPASLNNETYLPSSKTITYISPPPEITGATTPAFCLPLILIFALLGGALFYTGRNPFAGFAISTPRMGRHIRYTPTGRGFSLDTKRVAMSVQSAVSEGKGIRQAKAAGKTTGQAVAKASFGLEKGGAGKKVGQTVLNMITLGVYGSGKRVRDRLRLGAGYTGSVAAGGKGELSPTISIGALKAKDAKKKAAAQFVAATKGMERDPEAQTKKIFLGALKNLGIGMLSSSVAGGFIMVFKPNVFERMLSNVEKGMLDQADMKAATEFVAKQSFIEATGGVGIAPTEAKINIDIKKAKEVTVIENGENVTKYEYTAEDGGVIKVDAESLKKGQVIGTKTMTTADGGTVEYAFAGTEKGVALQAVQVEDARTGVVQIFQPDEKGDLHITGVGGRGGEYTLNTEGIWVNRATGMTLVDEAGAETERKGPATTAIEIIEASKPKEGKLTMGMLGIDAPGNINEQLSEFANVTVHDVYLEGHEGPITMSWGVGSEDYNYTETQKDGSIVTFQVEDGKVASASKTDPSTGKIVQLGTEVKEYGKPSEVGYAKEEAIEGTSVKVGQKVDIKDGYSTVMEKHTDWEDSKEAIALGLQSEAKQQFVSETGIDKSADAFYKERTKEMKKMEKKEDMSSKATVLLTSTPIPEDASSGEIEKIMQNSAHADAREEIISYAQNKIDDTLLKKPSVQAGIMAASTVGTDAADMKKAEYMAHVKTQLDMSTDLTTEQRAGAEKTAGQLWGKNGKAIKDIATGYTAAADQAINAYPKYTEMNEKLMDKHFEDYYKGKDPELKEDFTHAVNSGATSTKDLTQQIIDNTADNKQSASLANTDKEKALLNWAAYGLATPPKEPEVPEDSVGYGKGRAGEMEMKPYSQTEYVLQQKPGESEREYKTRLKHSGLAQGERESDEDYKGKLEGKINDEKQEAEVKINRYNQEKMIYEEQKKNYDKFTKDTEQAMGALVAQSAILSAGKKGKLPDKVYKDAYTATEQMNMSKWKSAADSTSEYVEQQKTKKQKKMAKSLKKFKP